MKPAALLPWLPVIALLGGFAWGGIKFYLETTDFQAVYEDEEITRFEDDEDRDAKLEWLRDRMNELRVKEKMPIIGWPK